MIGILILVLGALVLSGMSQDYDRGGDDNYFFIICVTIIAMGSLLMVVGLVGCCGAAYENQCLLGTVSLTQIKITGSISLRVQEI